MFTIGADPELFFKEVDTNKFTSVIGLLGGTKTNPFPIGNGCAIQEDNVAAEFCIPPSESVSDFIQSIQFSLGDLQLRASKLGLTLATMVASASFEKEQLRPPAARRFGCEPDYNAYTKSPNPRPQTTDKSLRSAGGHVHVGTYKHWSAMGKTLDLLLGVPSILLDPDENRRKLYGRAGACRPKEYGLEYRTLSNFWIWDVSTISWVYHQVKSAIEFCDEFNKESSPELSNTIQHCINNNDKKCAEELVKNWSLVLP